jgi:crotonobetainyl-CoA:carnitine CoA-transferase CaiB-like acyl-CoA transferase
MNADRRSILDMLAEGKITAEEAERLLSALDRPASASSAPEGEAAEPKRRAKYLRVDVDTEEGHGGPTKVNIRVPMTLLRAGVRLSSIIPPQARDHVNAAMREKGVTIDLNQLKPENLEELVDQLNDLTVDVDQEKTKVRIFCE